VSEKASFKNLDANVTVSQILDRCRHQLLVAPEGVWRVDIIHENLVQTFHTRGATSFEIKPCISVNGNVDRASEEHAEFWGLYGFNYCMPPMWIQDFETKEAAEAALALFQ
jgi:hypothetical protein